MSTTAPETKKPTVTVTLTVTYEAKPNMTIKELTDEGAKAERMRDTLKPFGGTISGEVTIGKQTFPL